MGSYYSTYETRLSPDYNECDVDGSPLTNNDNVQNTTIATTLVEQYDNDVGDVQLKTLRRGVINKYLPIVTDAYIEDKISSMLDNGKEWVLLYSEEKSIDDKHVNRHALLRTKLKYLIPVNDREKYPLFAYHWDKSIWVILCKMLAGFDPVCLDYSDRHEIIVYLNENAGGFERVKTSLLQTLWCNK